MMTNVNYYDSINILEKVLEKYIPNYNDLIPYVKLFKDIYGNWNYDYFLMNKLNEQDRLNEEKLENQRNKNYKLNITWCQESELFCSIKYYNLKHYENYYPTPEQLLKYINLELDKFRNNKISKILDIFNHAKENDIIKEYTFDIFRNEEKYPIFMTIDITYNDDEEICRLKFDLQNLFVYELISGEIKNYFVNSFIENLLINYIIDKYDLSCYFNIYFNKIKIRESRIKSENINLFIDFNDNEFHLQFDNINYFAYQVKLYEIENELKLLYELLKYDISNFHYQEIYEYFEKLKCYFDKIYNFKKLGCINRNLYLDDTLIQYDLGKEKFIVTKLENEYEFKNLISLLSFIDL